MLTLCSETWENIYFLCNTALVIVFRGSAFVID